MGIEGQQNQPVRLRPHHLLCTQSYEGRGYSREFTENMDRITEYLRKVPQAAVLLVKGTDDLCACCPNRRGKNLCKSQAQVEQFDSGTLECFRLEERIYSYRELTEQICAGAGPEEVEKICGRCGWYQKNQCKIKKILGG